MCIREENRNEYSVRQEHLVSQSCYLLADLAVMLHRLLSAAVRGQKVCSKPSWGQTIVILKSLTK